MGFRTMLLVAVLIGFFTGFLRAGSTTESMIWLILGISGVLGVLTHGMSREETMSRIRNLLS